MRFLLLTALLLSPAVAQQEPEHNTTKAQHSEESHGPGIGWTWANFLILAGGLGYLISKNAGPFFQARTDDIQSGLREAKKLRAESEARVAAIEKRVANLQTDLQSLRETAKAEMNFEAERIRLETARSIGKIQSNAENEIAFAAKLAQQQLRAHSADLAIQLAAVIVRDRLNAAKQEELVAVFVRQLATAQKVTH